jgi:phage-related protein
MIGKRLQAIFYRTQAGREPVRDWLFTLSHDDRRAIGFDIGRIEDGWPLGMPLARALDSGLWECRSTLDGGRIARVAFIIDGSLMVLLHGFEKKSQKTRRTDIETARLRRADYMRRIKS